MTSAPIATVAIITYNSAEQIEACLAAASQLEPLGSYELLVLDNASQDDTLQRVRASFPQVRLIAEGENWGFAGGVNRAAAAATGEYVLLLNPDATPEPSWARELLDALAQSGVGVAGSRVLEPDGRIQSLGSDIDMRVLLTAHRTAPLGEGLADVDAVHGAAMGFARHVWRQLGGFDEGFYPAYWEEVDFCERVRRAGMRCVVAPRAAVRHAEASSTGKYSPEFYGYYLRNRLRYAAKWLAWPELWGSFRPAEHARLRIAPMVDCQVASLVYDRGVPAPELPNASARASLRQLGGDLRVRKLPEDASALIDAQLALAEENSIHHEVQFTSRLGVLARFRTIWNSVATRWYVRPNLDQQTRYNLAVQRAFSAYLRQETARAAAQSLDVALLAYRIEQDSQRTVGN